jgi:tetratricopeptide (TPR) repeat protein
MSSNSESEAQSLETAIHRINTSNYDDALTICRNLIAANPEDCPVIAKAHLIAGHAYLLLGQLELSEQELRAGLQLDPSLAQGYIDLGFIFSKRKLHAEAISYYKRAKESSLVLQRDFTFKTPALWAEFTFKVTL